LNSVAILNAFRVDAPRKVRQTLRETVGLLPPPFDAEALPLPAIPATLTTKITASRGAFLEPVEELVAKEFFRDGQWPQPDLDLSFANQVRKLLSARE
jgi:hypothetical protein